jgi:hypothetical protein
MTKRIRVSPAAYVIQLFGGVNALARIIGRDPSSVSKWTWPRERRGADGLVPNGLQLLILEEAQKRNLDLTPADILYGREVIVPDEEPGNG